MSTKKDRITITAGVDIGSRTSKAVIVNNNDEILGEAILDTGIIPSECGRKALIDALSASGIEMSRLDRIVATGYGRVKADFAHQTVTEISCHARGVHAIDGSIRTIIDIGGQDSKVIKVDGAGRVIDFAMNDKCAAGTGKFLEVMSRALGTSLSEFAGLFSHSRNPCAISSMCTVFAESEVISLLAGGSLREDIIAGLHNAVADRISKMAMRLKVEQNIGFTGGVAKNAGMVKALEHRLNARFSTLNCDPQMIGAYGAAILAHR